MEIANAVRLVTPVPDSQYRLKNCRCGSDQVVYIQGSDEQWRVECLDCGNKTEASWTQHSAQVDWNWGQCNEES